jgi:hypothetical protein
MPSSVGPNIKGEENLVFGYDLGDVKNSYKGEPTVNLASNANFNNGTTGWNANQNVTLSVETINNIRFLKVKSNQTTSTPGFKSGNIAVSGNTTYTLTIRAYKNDNRSIWLYATGDGTGGADIVWTPAPNGPNPITTELTTISRTFTTPSDMTYLQIGALWSAPLTTSEVYVEYMQLEQKSHATPFVAGTRSVTQGLLDITGKSEIYLTNTLFDSNAQILFNGLGSNYIEIPDNPSLDISDNLTIEFWFKPYVYRSDLYTVNFIKKFTGTTDANFMFYFDGTYTPQKFRVLATRGGAWGSVSPDSSVIPLNTWIHVVWTYSNGGLLYINGVSQGTKTGSGVLSTNNTSIQIGSTLNGAVANYKMYKSALSAQEILDNYNAGKTRFSV